EPSAPNRAAIFEPTQLERDFVPRDVRRFEFEHLARENSVALEQFEREFSRVAGTLACMNQRPASREARLQPRANGSVVTSHRTARDRLERSLGAAIIGEHPKRREVVIADAPSRRDRKSV